MAVREIYKDKSGARLPSVTTILSRFKESGGLLYWANQCGLNGQTLDEARIPAATAGTMAHDLVEAHVNKRPLPELRGDPEIIAKARSAYDTFVKWAEMNKLTIRHTEVSLVSETHKFGGRLDAIGVYGNELILLDWKTSNSVYADYVLQLAGYKALWEENYPDHMLVGGFHLCRFAKEEGDFAHHYYPRLDAEVETFLAMRKLYDQVKAVEKRVK
jgi:PD-(D/E)XK nuclease superfamily protein